MLKVVRLVGDDVVGPAVGEIAAPCCRRMPVLITLSLVPGIFGDDEVVDHADVAKNLPRERRCRADHGQVIESPVKSRVDLEAWGAKGMRSPDVANEEDKDGTQPYGQF